MPAKESTDLIKVALSGIGGVVANLQRLFNFAQKLDHAWPSRDHRMG